MDIEAESIPLPQPPPLIALGANLSPFAPLIMAQITLVGNLSPKVSASSVEITDDVFKALSLPSQALILIAKSLPGFKQVVASSFENKAKETVVYLPEAEIYRLLDALR